MTWLLYAFAAVGVAVCLGLIALGLALCRCAGRADAAREQMRED
jgi:hypothetical protein